VVVADQHDRDGREGGQRGDLADRHIAAAAVPVCGQRRIERGIARQPIEAQAQLGGHDRAAANRLASHQKKKSRQSVKSAHGSVPEVGGVEVVAVPVGGIGQVTGVPSATSAARGPD
jgi:hypothetical protein